MALCPLVTSGSLFCVLDKAAGYSKQWHIHSSFLSDWTRTKLTCLTRISWILVCFSSQKGSAEDRSLV